MNRRNAIATTVVTTATALATVRLRGAPAVLRNSASLMGQTVDVRDYCMADGRRNDTEAFQQLLDRRPAEIVYPEGTRLTLDGPIALQSGQTHRFAQGARIDSEAEGFALAGFGRTGQHLAGLAEPIGRFAKRIVLQQAISASPGDMIVLADVSSDQNVALDVNLVDRVEGTALVTVYPIGRPFYNDGSFRLYKLDTPLSEVRFLGALTLANHHPKGGGLRLSNAKQIQLEGVTIERAGYVGIAIEACLHAVLNDIAVHRTGASGVGFRASKDIRLDGLTANGVQSDESLTFYDNVCGVVARRIDITQHVFQESPPGFHTGNDILVDHLCASIALSDVTCTGSATYNVMFNGQSDNCSLTDFSLRRSNLGGIRVSGGCDGTRIARGVISDVLDIHDSEGRKPVSAISVGTSCTRTVIGADISFHRIATGREVDALPERSAAVTQRGDIAVDLAHNT